MNKKLLMSLILMSGFIMETGAMQPRRRKYGSRGRGRNVMAEHKKSQMEFYCKLKKLGIDTPAQALLPVPVRGSQGTQAQFNKVRNELNTLLDTPNVDVAKFQAKIDELKKLNPARWPRAQDYQKLADMLK